MDLPERFNATSLFVDGHLAEGRGERTAFRVQSRAISYAELASTADRVGGVLSRLGVEMEHRVVLALGDSLEFAASFWGVVKRGGVAVPVNTLMGADDYAFILNESRARVVIVDDDVAPRVLAIRQQCPLLRHVIVTGPP